MIVDFYTRQEIRPLGGKMVKVPRTREEYLEACKSVLTEEDYVDILCAILDQEIYCSVDPHITDIVDRYYSFEN